MLKVENLTVKYGGITAVDGISLNIQQGETVAMIGANGAGKSTTLHAISGLQKICLLYTSPSHSGPGGGDSNCVRF